MPRPSPPACSRSSAAKWLTRAPRQIRRQMPHGPHAFLKRVNAAGCVSDVRQQGPSETLPETAATAPHEFTIDPLTPSAQVLRLLVCVMVWPCCLMFF